MRTSAAPRLAPFLGAEALPEGGARFRVWAPKRRTVEVVIEGKGEHALERGEDGTFSGALAQARAGDLYRYRLDGEGPFPDPASRFQPLGVHGPSEIVDPSAYVWRNEAWPGVKLRGLSVYELHLGTFTSEGTWAAAARELPRLAALGVGALEIMPVAEFPGEFGWGYDGTCLFAPSRLYGRPDDARRFVDEAHGQGLGVLLDVVYNHLGPDGNYLRQFSDDYFTDRYETPWGEAIAYDGPAAAHVRRFAAENAARWIAEYRFDGLRLDATQNVYDRTDGHVLGEICARARAAAGSRSIVLIAENETQDARLLETPERGGYGFDAIWNDDFHHAWRVALTGAREGYYVDYHGAPQELISCLKRGTLFQGQRSAWQRKARGTPMDGKPGAGFVTYLENHDQVANSSHSGTRLAEVCDQGLLRAATAVQLLGPGTPLLFQGQESGSRAPFTFFADHKPGLRELVWKGRRGFMAQFPSIADAVDRIADPAERGTFERCRLAPGPRAERWSALYRDLLILRRDDPVFAAQDAARLDGAVLGPHLFCARWFGEAGDDRLMLVNLGATAELRAQPEPLLAPPPGHIWRLAWSSEAPEYGGGGTPSVEPRPRWVVPARAAFVLAAREARRDS